MSDPVVLRRVRAGLIILLLLLLLLSILLNRGSLLVVLILRSVSRAPSARRSPPLLLSLWRVVRSAIAMPHTRLLSFAGGDGDKVAAAAVVVVGSLRPTFPPVARDIL